jgi:mRNA interferase MazF
LVKPLLYTPTKGDIVWLNFNPQSGHEQSGRRPALVISPLEYNEKTGLAIFCPITSHIKGYPFEVKLPEGLEISGVILSDQIKSLDWRARQAEFICKLPKDLLSESLNKLNVLIDISN